jgi:ATP-dependent helicase/DNAse subunit B
MLLRQVIEHKRAHPLAPVVITVPSARIKTLVEDRLVELMHDKRNMPDGRPAGAFGIRILTFYQLCQLILAATGVTCPVLPNSMRAAVLARVLARMNKTGGLPVLAPIASLGGTQAAILALIDELQRSALAPHAVLDKLAETAACDSRLMELGRVYREYSLELKELGRFDQHSLVFEARRSLEQGQRAGLDSTWVVVDGFDRVNRLQLLLLRALASRVERMSITFDYLASEEGREPARDYQWKQTSYEQLLDILKPSLLHVPGQANTEPAPPDIFSTLDRFAEMEEIARRCKMLVRADTEAAQILVVARNLEAYGQSIDCAFEGAGLPYFVDESIAVGTQPLVRFLQALMDCAANDFRRQEVIACLKSKYIKLKALGLTQTEVELIDEHSLARGLVAGATSWHAAATSLSAAAGKGIKRFIELVSPPSEMRTLSGFISWLEDLWDVLLNKIGWLEGDRQDGDGEDCQSFVTICTALRGLVEEEAVLGAELMPFESFSRRLKAVIEDGNFRRHHRFVTPSITICGADFAPNRSYDHVFVAGLIEGEFPRKAGSAGFVSEEELSLWGRFGIAMHNPRHHPGFEWALYRSLTERARKRVYLSYPRYSMGRDQPVPSFFLTGGAGDGEQTIPFLVPFDSAAAKPVSAREAVAGVLWRGPLNEIPEALASHADVFTVLEDIAAPLSVVWGRTAGSRATLYNGYLSDLVDSGALTINVPGAWSVSALNEYGHCPFRYWMSRVLRLERHEEPEPGLAANVRGDVYHKALELFFSKLKQERLLEAVEEEQWLPLYEQALAQAITWLEERHDFYPGPFWHYDKLEINFRLKRFVREELKRLNSDEEQLKPLYFEAKFGFEEEGSYPALVIGADGAAVRLRGKIDRIDVGAGREASQPARVRVIDYKSGSVSMPPRDAAEGRNLQIPIYALAAERVIVPGGQACRGIYLSIGSGQPAGRFDFQGKEHELMDLAQEFVLSYVKAVKGGDFTVRPNSQKACQTCRHDTICRIGELAPEGGNHVAAD